VFELEPSEDLELLVETARNFAAEELTPNARAFEAARRPSEAARRGFEQIGLAGLEVPEAMGGAGLGALARALVGEELGAGDPGAALALDPLGPVVGALREAAGDEAFAELASPLLGAEAGRAWLVAPGDAALVCEGGRAHGSVPWVPADRVALLLVLEPSGAFVVREGIEPRALPGAGLRAAGAAELRLDGAPIVRLEADAAACERALGRARLHVNGLLLGVLRHAVEFATSYARERVAFGRPIAHHQALAFLLTDMRMAVDGARWLLWEAAWRADAGLPFVAAAASAFVEAVEASRLVGPAAVQVLGGHGFMQDYPVEKAMRESRVLGLLCGGIDRARQDAGEAWLAEGTPFEFSHGELR
jgi:alkylation response protein AidB-like acyl-CoA dehydrogenase